MVAVNQLLICGQEHHHAVDGYGRALWDGLALSRARAKSDRRDPGD